MKEHTDATLTALIEAMHRNEPDTFIELVNNCHDLFGHDAAGHSLMWHARQSSNPVFAETLELLAAGKPFTEAEPSATDASDNKETTLDNQADEETSILPDNNKLDEKPESAASAESPTATSDSTAGYIKAIPVEKLGWAAAAVGLALLVSAYPLFLAFHFETGRGDSAMVFFACILNIMTLVRVLRELFHPSTPPSRGISCDFVPCLFASFVLGVGLIYPEMTEQGNAAYIWGPFGVLLLLSLAHVFYCERKNVDRWVTLAVYSLLSVVLSIAGIAFLEDATCENNDGFTAIVTSIAMVLIGLYNWFWFSEKSYGEDESEGAWRASMVPIMLIFYGFAAAVIPHVWYGTIYTVAEFATYHDMPSVVDTCLPGYGSLSGIQEKHVGSGRQWPKDALRFAVQQGDARSAEAYLRFMEKRDILNELACEFNLRPLKEVLPCRYFNRPFRSYLDLSEEAIEKQISFDEPEMLELLMNKDERVCIDAMMKHNAQKDALWLIQSNGCNATYGQYAEKRTLLQAAVEKNSLKMVELLMQYGANPDFAESGKTPRQMAEEKRWGYALKLFNDYQYKAQ